MADVVCIIQRMRFGNPASIAIARRYEAIAEANEHIWAAAAALNRLPEFQRDDAAEYLSRALMARVGESCGPLEREDDVADYLSFMLLQRERDGLTGAGGIA